MIKNVAEFVPAHLEKAIDLARHVATFGHFEFSPAYIRMRIADPAKVVHFDMILTPETYKCEMDYHFGVNLQMFYKILKSLNNDQLVEIECDDTTMKINQCTHYHTIIRQDIPLPPAEILDFVGPKVTLSTKLFQKYVRALANIAPAVEVHYVPGSDSLFLESVNSMYRTLFSIDTSSTPNPGMEEYRKQFVVKFLEMSINPSLADTVEVTFGDFLTIGYTNDKLSVLITIASYTEG